MNTHYLSIISKKTSINNFRSKKKEKRKNNISLIVFLIFFPKSC